MNSAPSLKGRALQCVAQREHSRAELRRKLLSRARADLQHRTADADDANATGDADLAGTAAEIEAVLDWMQAQGYLSDERFAESRARARAARFGNLRIHGELAQHGVALPPELAQDLQRSEQARALDVWRRKFRAAPADAAERARQTRFLAGRGFSADVIARLLKGLAREPG